MTFKVATESGEECAPTFEYVGVVYKHCTINGPNNPERYPQCFTKSGKWDRCIGKFEIIDFIFNTNVSVMDTFLD